MNYSVKATQSVRYSTGRKYTHSLRMCYLRYNAAADLLTHGIYGIVWRCIVDKVGGGETITLCVCVCVMWTTAVK